MGRGSGSESRGNDAHSVLVSQHWARQTWSAIGTAQCGVGELSLLPVPRAWYVLACGYYAMITVTKNHCVFQPRQEKRSAGGISPTSRSCKQETLVTGSFSLAEGSSPELGVSPWVSTSCLE